MYDYNLTKYIKKYNLKDLSYYVSSNDINPESNIFDEIHMTQILRDIFDILKDKGFVAKDTHCYYDRSARVAWSKMLWMPPIIDKTIVFPAFTFTDLIDRANVYKPSIIAGMRYDNDFNCPKDLSFNNDNIVYVHTLKHNKLSDKEIELFNYVKSNEKNILIIDSSLARIDANILSKYADVNLSSLGGLKYFATGAGGLVEIFNNTISDEFKKLHETTHALTLIDDNISLLHLLCTLYYFDNVMDIHHNIFHTLYKFGTSKIGVNGQGFVYKEEVDAYDLHDVTELCNTFYFEENGHLYPEFSEKLYRFHKWDFIDLSGFLTTTIHKFKND